MLMKRNHFHFALPKIGFHWFLTMAECCIWMFLAPISYEKQKLFSAVTPFSTTKLFREWTLILSHCPSRTARVYLPLHLIFARVVLRFLFVRFLRLHHFYAFFAFFLFPFVFPSFPFPLANKSQRSRISTVHSKRINHIAIIKFTFRSFSLFFSVIFSIRRGFVWCSQKPWSLHTRSQTFYPQNFSPNATTSKKSQKSTFFFGEICVFFSSSWRDIVRFVTDVSAALSRHSIKMRPVLFVWHFVWGF